MSKLFYTKFSELSGKRFDPKYNNYIARYKVLLNNSVKLGSLLLKKPQYGANESAIDYNQNCRYIRITDIDEFGLLKNDGLKSAKHEEEQYRLKYHDLLIARSGATVGKSYLHQDKDLNAIFAGYMIRFKFDKSKINPAYIFYYTQLDIYKRWTEAIQRSAGQPNINAEEYQDLDIPILSLEIQNNVVSLMEYAYQQKQQKEQEAKEKLESIDDYLLDALGIELPEKQDESVEDRVFFRKFSELSGKRQDVYYYKQSFVLAIEKIKKAKYEILTLGKLLKDLKNGIEVRNYIENGGIRYLRVTDLGKNGLSNRSPKFVATQTIPKRIQLNSNCILISRSGSLGLVNIVDESIENAILSSHIFKVELKSNILPLYAEVYFRSMAGQIEIFRNNNGGVIPEINQTALKSIRVVLPPMQKQMDIVNKVQQLRRKAKALKEEATQIYNDAKVEVEKMILGEKI